MAWVHNDARYRLVYNLLPDVDHSSYSHSVQDAYIGAMAKFNHPEDILEFFDIRIAEFEKKMNYYDGADREESRHRLNEVAFLRKRLDDFITGENVRKLTKQQRPFTLGRREEKIASPLGEEPAKAKSNTVSGFQ